MTFFVKTSVWKSTPDFITNPWLTDDFWGQILSKNVKNNFYPLHLHSKFDFLLKVER